MIKRFSQCFHGYQMPFRIIQFLNLRFFFETLLFCCWFWFTALIFWYKAYEIKLFFFVPFAQNVVLTSIQTFSKYNQA